MIDQADQPEPLRHRYDIGREQHLAVALLHPHQAFVERRLARARSHDRLERRDDAAVVQRGDDLVGDADVDAALRVALDIGPPQPERAGTAALGGIQRFLGAVDRFIGIAGIAGNADRADRGRHRHRTGPGRHHLVADAGEETLGGDIGVVDGAVLQDQAELVAGEAAEHVAGAQPRADPRGDLGDHGVRHIEAEGVVDARQMIDADQHEGAGRAEAGVLLDRLGKCGDQMGAIELAGERIMPRQFQQLLVAGVALIVDAHDALRPPWPAVRAGKPDAGLLDPDHRRRGGGAHAIFDAVRHALVGPRRRRMGERVLADRAGRLDQLGEVSAGRQRFRGDVGEHGRPHCRSS